MVDKVQEDLKQAQLSRDEVKVSTLRLLLSEIRNAEIAKGGQLSDQEVISIIQKEVKKRQEAAAGFRSGAREDQAQKEEAEQKVLTKIVEDTITEVGDVSHD